MKIVLIGSSGCGKSSVTQRYVRGTINQHSSSTIGAAYVTKEYYTEDGRRLLLEFWDTSGQERYMSLAPLYYRSAEGVVIVFDLSEPRSFERAIVSYNDVKQHTSDEKIFALVGNKNDLAQQVDEQLIKSFAERNNIPYYSVSALTGQGVENPFNYVAATYLDNYTDEQNKRVISLTHTPEQDDSSCPLCW